MREDLIDILAEEAKSRRRAFIELSRKLNEIKNSVKRCDQTAEIYLFGSVARGDNTLGSDIDVLIITGNEKCVRAALASYGPPFEFHIYDQDYGEFFLKGYLIRVN